MMTDRQPTGSEHSLFQIFSWFVELCKIRLSLFIGFSTLVGYLIHQPQSPGPAFFTASAVFILCCGCASLNNVQDRAWDDRFERTRKRVLPEKRLSLTYACVQAMVLVVFGLWMLTFVSFSATPFFLGMASLVLYNGMYTPLKPLSLVALVPGVLCGMVPPLIGWTAAGNGLPDARILSVMMVFGLWQLPHLGLLILCHPNDYADKKVPCFLRQVSERALKRMIIFWVFNVSLMMVCLIFKGF